MRSLLVPLMAVVLIGCGEESDGGQLSGARVVGVATETGVDHGAEKPLVAGKVAQAERDFSGRELRNPLPEDVQLPFPYHRLNDNTVQGSEGAQRRIYVEIRRVEPKRAEARVLEALRAHNFVVSRSEGLGRASETTLERDDGALVTIRVEHDVLAPQAPDATGKLHLVWDPA